MTHNDNPKMYYLEHYRNKTRSPRTRKIDTHTHSAYACWPYFSHGCQFMDDLVNRLRWQFIAHNAIGFYKQIQEYYRVNHRPIKNEQNDTFFVVAAAAGSS